MGAVCFELGINGCVFDYVMEDDQPPFLPQLKWHSRFCASTPDVSAAEIQKTFHVLLKLI